MARFSIKMLICVTAVTGACLALVRGLVVQSAWLTTAAAFAAALAWAAFCFALGVSPYDERPEERREVDEENPTT